MNLLRTLAVMLAISASMFPVEAQADLQLTPAQCSELSEAAEAAAEMRDIGADVSLYVAALRVKNPGVSREAWAVIQQEVEMAFRSPMLPRELALEVLLRCKRLEGRMGIGV